MRILLACLVLAILLIYFIYPILRAIRVSKDIETHTIAYEQHPANATMHILVAGDSTGVGTGAELSQDSIAGRIGADIPDADIENVSQNGLKLAGLSSVLEALPKKHYDLIVIQIGANDITHFTSMQNVREELTSVLGYTESHATSTILLTAGNVGTTPIFKAPLSYVITRRTLQVRDIFRQTSAGSASVTYVDLFKDSIDDLFASDTKKYYARDHFHPSSDGYGVWYEALRPVLESVLFAR